MQASYRIYLWVLFGCYWTEGKKLGPSRNPLKCLAKCSGRNKSCAILCNTHSYPINTVRIRNTPNQSFKDKRFVWFWREGNACHGLSTENHITPELGIEITELGSFRLRVQTTHYGGRGAPIQCQPISLPWMPGEGTTAVNATAHTQQQGIHQCKMQHF